MNLISLILVIIAVALISWAVNRWIPMQEPYKWVVNILLLLLVVLLLLDTAKVIDVI